MSTKISLSHSNDHHLWEEIFDKSNVYLEIYGYQYEVSNNVVMMQIPIKVWRSLLEDWNKRGWPEEEDHEEIEISDKFLSTFEDTLESIGKGNQDE
jgi:hypothetical protein